ncbi:hypothetical protein chiPu_0026614, partial [Chiloscyllium punctatum]|nr:hypothetical protein [Chiloscyllium punctatum]
MADRRSPHMKMVDRRSPRINMVAQPRADKRKRFPAGGASIVPEVSGGDIRWKLSVRCWRLKERLPWERVETAAVRAGTAAS